MGGGEEGEGVFSLGALWAGLGVWWGGGRAVYPLLLLSQGSEHLAAVDAPNPLKERFPALGLRAVAFDL